jgi:hypothetical protein
MKRFASPRALAAALATALTLSLGLAAGSSFAAPERGDRHGKWMNAPHARAMGPMFQPRALIRLRDELKLDAQQEALRKEAQASAREHRGAIRARMDKDHAEIKALLDQPGIDLRAVVKRMDELRAESLKQLDAIRDRWFAVYDSLGEGQKEKARLFFKDGMERTERLTERGRKGPGRGHPRHDRRPPTAPAAPPAQ